MQHSHCWRFKKKKKQNTWLKNTKTFRKETSLKGREKVEIIFGFFNCWLPLHVIRLTSFDAVESIRRRRKKVPHVFEIRNNGRHYRDLHLVVRRYSAGDRIIVLPDRGWTTCRLVKRSIFSDLRFRSGQDPVIEEDRVVCDMPGDLCNCPWWNVSRFKDYSLPFASVFLPRVPHRFLLPFDRGHWQVPRGGLGIFTMLHWPK